MALNKNGKYFKVSRLSIDLIEDKVKVHLKGFENKAKSDDKRMHSINAFETLEGTSFPFKKGNKRTIEKVYSAVKKKKNFKTATDVLETKPDKTK